jgi:hypothetical protein
MEYAAAPSFFLTVKSRFTVKMDCDIKFNFINALNRNAFGSCIELGWDMIFIGW